MSARMQAAQARLAIARDNLRRADEAMRAALVAFADAQAEVAAAAREKETTP